MAIAIPPENFGSTDPTAVIDGEKDNRDVGFLFGTDVKPVSRLEGETLKFPKDTTVFVTVENVRFQVEAGFTCTEAEFEALVTQHSES